MKNEVETKEMTTSERYDYYVKAVNFMEILWAQLMREDAFEILGCEGWDLLRETYDKARDEQRTRFHAWLDSLPAEEPGDAL